MYSQRHSYPRQQSKRFIGKRGKFVACFAAFFFSRSTFKCQGSLGVEKYHERQSGVLPCTICSLLGAALSWGFEFYHSLYDGL